MDHPGGVPEAPALRETLSPYPNVIIIQGDILQLDPAALIASALSGDSHHVSPDDLVAVEAMAYDLTMPTVVGDRNEVFNSAVLDFLDRHRG